MFAENTFEEAYTIHRKQPRSVTQKHKKSPAVGPGMRGDGGGFT